MDFTPWVAENVDLLADAVGLDITVDETESSVGDFNVDIYASETGSDRKIIIIEELLDKNYDSLMGINCSELKNEVNQKKLIELNAFMSEYYDVIRRNVKEKNLKNTLSYTLITKILMGTMGCVPAYDRYFIAGIKNQKVATGSCNIKSILQLADFYERNESRLEPVRENMRVYDLPYPQMKMIDMGFWQIGFDLDTNKEIKVTH